MWDKFSVETEITTEKSHSFGLVCCIWEQTRFIEGDVGGDAGIAPPFSMPALDLA